jgi:hypothetical protein
MNEYKTPEEFWAAVQSGKVSQEEFYKTMKAFGSSTDAVSNDWRQAMASEMEKYRNTPEAKDYMNTLLKERAGDRFVKNFKPFFTSILQGVDVANSLSQIRTANNAVRALVPPTLPQSPGPDPALSGAIAKAQQGTFDASRAIAPIKQAANDRYQTDINNAKVVSNGQAGAYGSYAQAASNERYRSGGQQAAVADQVRAREQARLDGLIGMRAGNAQQDFSNRMQGTQIAMDQYNRNALAASTLGSVGRVNLRNSLQGLPESALRTAGAAMYPVRTPGFGGQSSSSSYPSLEAELADAGRPSSIDQRISDYGGALESNLVQHMMRSTGGPIPNRYINR